MVHLAKKITSFDLQPGQVIGGKYVVEELIGKGVQGEVYRVVERRTRIRRAAKLFYPKGNERDHAARSYARKLDRLRHCPMLIQYHHAETFPVQSVNVTCLISDFVDGVLLSEYVARHPGKRLHPFKALHVIYPIVFGLEQIHAGNEYHGDLHEQNILIRPYGIFFEVKIVDFFDHGRSSRDHRRDDIVNVARLLHWMVGGRQFYARQPQSIKSVCLGLRRDRIIEHFPTAARLRRHLDEFPALEAI